MDLVNLSHEHRLAVRNRWSGAEDRWDAFEEEWVRICNAYPVGWEESGRDHKEHLRRVVLVMAWVFRQAYEIDSSTAAALNAVTERHRESGKQAAADTNEHFLALTHNLTKESTRDFILDGFFDYRSAYGDHGTLDPSIAIQQGAIAIGIAATVNHKLLKRLTREAKRAEPQTWRLPV